MNHPLPTTASSPATSAALTHRKSRGALPAKHPSRLGPGNTCNEPRTPWTVGMSRTGPTSSTRSAPGWGVQWTTLQGLASSALGNDALSSDTEHVVKQRRKPVNAVGTGGIQKSNSSSSWFSTVTAPDGETESLGRGSMRPRGRRRENISNGTESASSSTKRNRYKRATSPDPDSDVDLELERDGERDGAMETLVYVHHVKPTDTIEGVVIAFNIHPSTLRKANGMWSQDSVQSRKTLLLPVDDCHVKGKPVGLIHGNETVKMDQGKAKIAKIQPQEDQVVAEDEEEKPYKHESHVIIEGIGQVEIARLARKKLSHFPPRRRKSNSIRRLSSLGDTSPGYSTHLSFLDDPPPPSADVFRGMTPGVGELHPQYSSNHNASPGGVKLGPSPGPGIALGPDTFTMKTVGEIVQDTATGLESVGSVVEGFVRRWTVKAQGFVGNDLIELTQGLGFEEGQGGRGVRTETSGSARNSGSIRSNGGESAITTAGDGKRRVVRERLPRSEGEE